MKKLLILPEMAGILSALSTAAAQSAAVQGKKGSDFSQLNSWMSNVSGSISWIGCVIAFMGVIMLIRSFATDSAETRSRAVFVMIVGGMISALATTVTVANLSW